MSKTEVGVKRTMDLQNVIEYLQDLAVSMKMGEVYVQKGSEYLAMSPAPSVFVEIKAKRKKGREKFSLSLAWHMAGAEGAGEEKELRISASPPEGTELHEDEQGEEDDGEGGDESEEDNEKGAGF